ncbi:hypothetical protein L210DRAFT_3503815 [Boletus edulis BED1]|uniref:Uncharacterized protein n=1 Tax=Boletus edulis BED1 TaxID=1328754 RepID=A0AAD4GFH4_BOLED|nr:hypothetical protein L210DRAFT_3503815 [Boletus edulis BED1]
MAGMIKWAEELICKHGIRNTIKFTKFSVKICRVLQNKLAYGQGVQEARHCGWPMKISWHKLPGRIMAMKDTCVENPRTPALGDYQKLGRLASAPIIIYHNLQPGYYGQKGRVVIEATLLSMVAVLIAQDMQCNTRLTYQIMCTSNSVGDVLHSYNENQEDDKIEDNFKAIMMQQ